VFNPEERPWVDVDAADPEATSTTILTCPTGALHFRRLDGGTKEEPEAETTVEPRPNGPLFVRGRVRIIDPDGHLIREDTRLALCRCGVENKPFCDGSHRQVGFTTAPAAAEGEGEAGDKRP
jgi:CDGSH-type Zn-finger protein